jgi:hypothetical protein
LNILLLPAAGAVDFLMAQGVAVAVLVGIAQPRVLLLPQVLRSQ